MLKTKVSLFKWIIAVIFLITAIAFVKPSEPEKTVVLEKTVVESIGEMKVHFIDVGQGDSILIESDGKYMLIDAGENIKGDVVISYLKEQGVEKLAYIIGTHPHSDHIGGLDTVINSFEVGKVILPAKDHTTNTFEDLLNAIADIGLKITKATVGDTYKLGSSEFIIIAPNGDYDSDLNNWSVGIKLTLGNTSFAMYGDAESFAEKDMLTNGIDLSADVLKLSHHGSNTSTSDVILDAINPSYAVISCGSDNQYGHPHEEIINKLKVRDIDIFRTDEQGTIVATTDGTVISWNMKPSKSYAVGETDVVTISKTSASSAIDVTNKVDKDKIFSYVFNENSMIFHYSNCTSVKQMKEENKIYFEGLRSEVVTKGYKACQNCNP